MGCTEATADKTPVINCLVCNEEQKEYCQEMVKKWDNPQTIKYVIKDGQPAFSVKLMNKGKESDIQTVYTNNSEEEMKATLEKAYALLK